MSGKHWTNEEVEFLVNNYQSFGVNYISEKLNKSFYSVFSKALKLRLTKTKKTANPVKIGEIFDRLTAISFSGNKNKKRLVNCQCLCGNTCIVVAPDLRNGQTRSCGCLAIDRKSLAPGISTWNFIYARYKQNARYRNIEFLVNKEEFIEIASLNCQYCGAPPRPTNRYVKQDGSIIDWRTGNTAKRPISDASVNRSWIKANGVDRKNNYLGYTKENSVPCCEKCNRFKLDHSEKDFLLHCFRIIKFQLTTRNKPE